MKIIFGASLICWLTFATAVAQTKPMSFYDLSTQTLAGTEVALADYRGKVALVVNLASRCGYTPQYAGLEKIYGEYAAQGFVVLGFPSNDFGGQEPGTPQEIAAFCATTYKVTFPLFAKVVTKGPEQSLVYQFLTAQYSAPKWNFHKYLLNKTGQVTASYSSGIKPESPEIRAAIEAELKK